MKFVELRPFADPDSAARKLVEIASTVEPVLYALGAPSIWLLTRIAVKNWRTHVMSENELASPEQELSVAEPSGS